MVKELSEDTFDAFIEKNAIAVVDCWAPWCRPCRMIAPIIEELAKDMDGKAAFGKLNTDENQGIAMRFEINAIPTLLVFKDGVMHEPLVGLRPKEEIKEYILSV